MPPNIRPALSIDISESVLGDHSTSDEVGIQSLSKSTIIVQTTYYLSVSLSVLCTNRVFCMALSSSLMRLRARRMTRHPHLYKKILPKKVAS